MRILIVDDIAVYATDIEKAIKNNFEGTTLKVISSREETGKDAREHLKECVENKNPYDVSILDLRLDERPNIAYLTARTADIFEGYEIFNSYKNILGYCLFVSMSEYADVVEVLGDPGFIKDVVFVRKDFDADEFVPFTNEIVKEITRYKQSQKGGVS